MSILALVMPENVELLVYQMSGTRFEHLSSNYQFSHMFQIWGVNHLTQRWEASVYVNHYTADPLPLGDGGEQCILYG